MVEMPLGHRIKIGKYYVNVNKYGHFQKWTSIAKSLAYDRGNNAKTKVKAGYGHLGDVK